MDSYLPISRWMSGRPRGDAPMKIFRASSTRRGSGGAFTHQVPVTPWPLWAARTLRWINESVVLRIAPRRWMDLSDVVLADPARTPVEVPAWTRAARVRPAAARRARALRAPAHDCGASDAAMDIPSAPRDTQRERPPDCLIAKYRAHSCLQRSTRRPQRAARPCSAHESFAISGPRRVIRSALRTRWATSHCHGEPPQGLKMIDRDAEASHRRPSAVKAN